MWGELFDTQIHWAIACNSELCFVLEHILLGKTVEGQKIRQGQCPGQFLSTWHELEPSGKRKLRNFLNQSGRRQFSGLFHWWVIDSWRAQPTVVPPLTDGHWLYKKANWARHGEQARKLCSSVVSAPVPAPRFLLWLGMLHCNQKAK